MTKTIAQEITKVADSIYGEVLANIEKMSSVDVAQVQKKAFNVATMLQDLISQCERKEATEMRLAKATRIIDGASEMLLEFYEFLEDNTCVTPQEMADWCDAYRDTITELIETCPKHFICRAPTDHNTPSSIIQYAECFLSVAVSPNAENWFAFNRRFTESPKMFCQTHIGYMQNMKRVLTIVEDNWGNNDKFINEKIDNLNRLLGR
ncbi:MAG: hypothetical protein ACK5GV_01210 [Bacteroidota bacterium]|jgi:hypothetical protein